VGQDLLTPVWVFRAYLAVDKEPVPMRLITVPATDSARLFLRPQPASQPGEPIAARSLAAINPFQGGTLVDRAYWAGCPVANRTHKASLTGWLPLGG